MQSANSRLAFAMSDQVLPSEVSFQSETWLYRYRHYPVFSRTWFRYRTYSFIGVQTILLAILALLFMLVTPDINKLYVFSVPILFGSTALCALGQFMAVKVRQKNYPARKESVLLIGALCLGAALSWGIFDGLRYSAKYFVYGDGNIVLYVGAKASIQTPQTLNEKSQISAANSATAESVPKSTAVGADSKVDTNGEMTIRFFQILPSALVCIYIGSGFDLWVFYRQRKKLTEALRQQELNRAQDARREAELRLSVLVAQVEPHFLFNTLAGVRSAILTEPARATAIVDHLVDYLRATIPQMRDDGATVQGRLVQQLEAAKAYLALMQARIPRLSFTVESDIAEAALPPLMLISLVENAIKHGVEPKIGPVHISVTAKKLKRAGEELLELTVADSGVGFGGATSGSGIGLANIRERLEATFGQRASLQLKARPEGGIAATIVLPLLN